MIQANESVNILYISNLVTPDDFNFNRPTYSSEIHQSDLYRPRLLPPASRPNTTALRGGCRRRNKTIEIQPPQGLGDGPSARVISNPFFRKTCMPGPVPYKSKLTPDTFNAIGIILFPITIYPISHRVDKTNCKWPAKSFSLCIGSA